MNGIQAVKDPSASTHGSEPRHKTFGSVWYACNLLLVLSTLLAAYAVTWEYSTRRYLQGFSDAIVPESRSAQDKIEAIVDWMAHGPARQQGSPSTLAPNRDPTDTLNYIALLRVCGSATNAFINLADSAGVPARRLLLLDSHRMAKHVVAEALVDGRWIVVDPAFRTFFRGSDGRLLTRQELADSATLLAATRSIPNYNPNYTYEKTAHIRVRRLGAVGVALGKLLDLVVPNWEGSAAVSLLLERKSLATMVTAVLSTLLLILFRTALSLWGKKWLRIYRMPVRARMSQAFAALLDTRASP